MRLACSSDCRLQRSPPDLASASLTATTLYLQKVNLYSNKNKQMMNQDDETEMKYQDDETETNACYRPMEDSMDMNMSPLRPQNYLFSCELKADKDYHFKVDNDENEHQLSLRTVSLGAGAKEELHIVEAKAMIYEGSPIKATLATVKMAVQPTVSLGGF
ncbi:Nucleophosmin [Myotis brandtii]|uniref:Nucleophosmin n=1 Tax=Myotis brandtii TaxID=109478 RepID=S7MHM0_MYOBR|nr:Nucleophosmin [Myotis brandtii]